MQQGLRQAWGKFLLAQVEWTRLWGVRQPIAILLGGCPVRMLTNLGLQSRGGHAQNSGQHDLYLRAIVKPLHFDAAIELTEERRQGAGLRLDVARPSIMLETLPGQFAITA